MRIRLLVMLGIVLLILTVTIWPPVQAQPASRHLLLGNPSGAVTDANAPANYLLVRDQYATGYHRDDGIPLWASWSLSAADIGVTPRTDAFAPDTSLPAGWYQVRPDDYSGSGLDRGHVVPSADRTLSVADNEATFLMTNMIPQAPNVNRGPWNVLEADTRAFLTAGQEVAIVAGVLGERSRIAEGRVRVPEAVWKVLIAFPEGDDDLARIDGGATVRAVLMPNDDDQVAQADDWQAFCATVDSVEAATGYDLFSALPDGVEAVLEAQTVTTGAASVRPTGGDRQETPAGQAFAEPLRVTVCNADGQPVAGVDVTFTMPAFGPFGSFTIGGTVEVVTTDGNGVATSSLPIANTVAGSFEVTAAVPGVAAPATFTLTNGGGTQAATGVYLPLVVGAGQAPPPPVPTTTPTPTTVPVVPTATPIPTTPPVVPTATPTLPPPSFTSCSAQPNAASAPNYPVRIVAIDKDGETVTLRNVTTGDVISLEGWRMCSITGGQQHPGISGTLAPGESRVFVNSGGPIWNNSSSDPGALYDAEGRLVSYWAD